jgi:hypothetical protein
MGEAGDATRSAVRVAVVLLCVGAALLILIILNGSRLNATAGRALLTAVAFAFFSITSAAGLRLARHPHPLFLLGYLTIGISLVAFVVTSTVIWSHDASGDQGRIAISLTIVALGSGQISQLLFSARPEDSDAVAWVRAGVIAAIVALCAMTIVEISSPGQDVGARPIGVVAVLYLLGCLLLPLLRRIGPTL